ncbi:MAG: hypothetical protein OES57_00485 [Acidimicrobiia bacterium]|nr:hypothetical protein [Acidimicrobiia bacterium]
MSRRGRALTALGVFVLGLVLLEMTARVVVASADPADVVWYDASTQLRVEMLDELESVDVVFAGTSSAWQGLVPDLFVAHGAAESAFNAGLAGGVPAVTSPWLLDEVVPRTDPDVVVWGLTSLDFSAAYGHTNEEAYDEAFETRHGWLADLDRALSEVSELVRSRRLLRNPSMLWGQAQDDIRAELSEAASITGAHGERLDFTEDVSPERAAIMQARVRDYEVDQHDVDLVGETVRALQAQGRTVVFVEIPFPERFVRLHPNGAADIDEAADTIDAIAAEHGITVVRSTETFTDDDFVDFSHLSAEAAARFSADIARQLHP